MLYSDLQQFSLIMYYYQQNIAEVIKQALCRNSL